MLLLLRILLQVSLLRSVRGVAPTPCRFLLDSKTGCGSQQGCTRCDVVLDWDVAKARRHLFNTSASCEGCMEFWLSSEDVWEDRAARTPEDDPVWIREVSRHRCVSAVALFE